MEKKILKNGFCFLSRAIKNLKDSKDSNAKNEELKYAILHLWSGVFLILKVRLCREHWNLLVSNRGKTTFENFCVGSFQGVRFDQCKDRLLKVLPVGVFNGGNEELLNNLRKKRNKIEHFFEDEISSDSTSSILYKSLNFIIGFIRDHIEIKDTDHEIIEYKEEIIKECLGLKKFVEEKMDSIQPLLDKKKITLHCYECDNLALAHSTCGDFLECLFCGSKVSGDSYPHLSECMDLYCDGIIPCEVLICDCEGENGIVRLIKIPRILTFVCLPQEISRALYLQLL